MKLELPSSLQAALARELEGVPRADLAARAARISGTYRTGGGSAAVIQEDRDALAYALSRLPATYAACAVVFAEVKRMAPAFTPQSLLDAGSGPGAASWAAAFAWPELRRIVWLDASAPFLTLAQRLAAAALAPLNNPQMLRADLAAPQAWPKSTLVVASYALAEIADADQSKAVAALWSACEGLLILIEPGTPAGFARVRAARDALITAGAQIVAPCPHAETCPVIEPDWCHFAVRLPRSRDHRMTKGAELAFEDEKFAYLVAARPDVSVDERKARILAAPRAGKTGLTLKLCSVEGLSTRHVPRRDKDAHAKVRRLGWGDVVDP